MINKRHYIECSCTGSNPNCLVILDYYDSKLYGKEMYLHLQLNQYNSFWKRLVLAVKYLFKIEDNSYHWSETVLGDKEIRKLYEFLHEIVKEDETNDNTN